MGYLQSPKIILNTPKWVPFPVVLIIFVKLTHKILALVDQMVTWHWQLAKDPENSMTVDGNGSYITIAVPNAESPGISDQTVTNNDFTTTNLDPALNGSYITVTQAMS